MSKDCRGKKGAGEMRVTEAFMFLTDRSTVQRAREGKEMGLSVAQPGRRDIQFSSALEFVREAPFYSSPVPITLSSL